MARLMTLPAMLLGILGATCLIVAQQKTDAGQHQEITFERLKLGELMEDQIRGARKRAETIPAQNRIFADAESWRAFWGNYGVGKIPPVDFAKHQIAVIALGPMPNPGYGVEISKITYSPSDKQVVFHVTEFLPGTCGFTQNQVYPADFVLFPQMTGSPKFERTKKECTP